MTMPSNECVTYPLTPMQEGMLFHSISAPGTGVEVEQIVSRSREPLDAGALQEAWRRVIARHEALRTIFRLPGVGAGAIAGAGAGAPVQEVLPELPVTLERLPADTDLEALLATDRAHDFELDRSCMRVRLCARDGDWFMLWSFHHAILDGRSFPLILHELFDTYGALRRGEAVPELPAPPRFTDFATHVAGRDHDASRDFWRAMLSGVEPADHPLVGARPRVNSGDFGGIELRLDAAQAARARAFAAERGVTMNTLLQTAWSIVVHNHTRAFDVVFGGTRACRHVPVADAADMVGLLINTVPMRASVSAPTLDAMLRATRERWVALREHELTPLTLVQKWAQADGALFDAIVVFEQAELRDTLRGLGGEWLERDFLYRGRTGYPLTLIGYDGESPLLRLEYDRALVDDDLAARLLDQTAHGLCAMPDHADAPPAHLPIVSPEERARLLRLASPQRDYRASAASIPDRILGAASDRPHAHALRAGDGTQDYATLLARSASIASALSGYGVGRGSRVGIMLERGIGAVEAMLGVLRAGACYVPIDADAPADRVRFIAEDAGVELILSDSPSQVADRTTLHPAQLADMPTRPLPDPEPDDAAYVIYTSGSTGRPKGVVVTHANVTRLLDACAERFDLRADDVWSCFHSFSFDFSVWEIWCALMTGACAVIARRDEVRSPRLFTELLARERVTVLSQTPSAFRQLQNEVLAQRPTDFALRYVVFGGEALEPATLRAWFDVFGDERPAMINMYGITETTVHVTFRRVVRAVATRADSPIGEPLPDLGILLVNAGGGLAPAGTPAEMLVCGGGVARGYLNRADLTAERFVERADRPGVRFYRSGDLARLERDGGLRFLGRADQQVKVRGHRIEPAEVEDALRRLDGVRDARVVARRFEGGVELVGYYIATGEALPAAALREGLQRLVPSYMVPKWFVAVGSFALTVNGKLDTKALPDPERERDQGSEFVAPVSAVEQAIARVWSETLGVPRVGTRDNFFDLGGDSLLLVRTAGALAEQLGRQVDVVRLFEYPTVESLAAFLAGTASDDRYEEIAARAARQRGNFLAARRG